MSEMKYLAEVSSYKKLIIHFDESKENNTTTRIYFVRTPKESYL